MCLFYLADAAAAPEEKANFVPSDTSDLTSYEGYGNVGFQAGEFLPPPPPTYEESQDIPSMEFGQ